QAYSVALGDLSGDGDADLAYVNGSTHTISVRLNQGDGTFGAATDYPTDSYPYGIAIADLDEDGRMDVAVTNTGSTVNTLWVRLGAGGGALGPQTSYSTGYGPNTISVGDLDGDGHL